MGCWGLGVGSSRLEVRSWELEVGGWELGVGSWKFKTKLGDRVLRPQEALYRDNRNERLKLQKSLIIIVKSTISNIKSTIVNP